MSRARGQQALEPRRVFLQKGGKHSSGGGRVGDFLGVGINSGGGDVAGQRIAVAVQNQAAPRRQDVGIDPVGVGFLLKIRMPGSLEIDQAPGQHQIKACHKDKYQSRAGLNNGKMLLCGCLLSCHRVFPDLLLAALRGR